MIIIMMTTKTLLFFFFTKTVDDSFSINKTLFFVHKLTVQATSLMLSLEKK